MEGLLPVQFSSSSFLGKYDYEVILFSLLLAVVLICHFLSHALNRLENSVLALNCDMISGNC